MTSRQDLETERDRVRQQLMELEARLGEAVPGVEPLEERPESPLTYEEVRAELEDPPMDLVEDEETEEIREKRAIFLGSDPSSIQRRELVIDKSVAERITHWIGNGLPKEEKEASLESIPLKGSTINLEAPQLNPEVGTNLKSKAAIKDNYFKSYQTLAGASVAAAAEAFEQVLEQIQDSEEKDTLLASIAHVIKLSSDLFFQLNVARKSFLVGAYDERTQKLLKEARSTSLLFGDDLKNRIESAKTLEKAAKELLLKPKQPLKPKENLNWKAPYQRREKRGGSPKRSRQPLRSHKLPAYKAQPAKGYYSQSQPQRETRR